MATHAATRTTRRPRLALGICSLLIPVTVRAGVVEMPAARDNTIFEVHVTNSNGAGSHLFVGNTDSTVGVRRALLRFDVAAAVPLGVHVDSVQLVLRLNRSNDDAGLDRTLQLHRVLVDWGEAGSNSDDDGSGYGGGRGALALPGDATWTHRIWPDEAWAAFGGEYAPVASGAAVVSQAVGTAFTWSGAGLVADVQAWLDEPSTNFGWILIGDESEWNTARRFGAREHADIGQRPVLVVVFNTTAVEPRTWSRVKALFRSDRTPALLHQR